MESDFYLEILKIIERRRQMGPIRLQIGRRKNCRKIEEFIPIITCFLCDNEGGNHVMCVRGIMAKRNCRFCLS